MPTEGMEEVVSMWTGVVEWATQVELGNCAYVGYGRSDVSLLCSYDIPKITFKRENLSHLFHVAPNLSFGLFLFHSSIAFVTSIIRSFAAVKSLVFYFGLDSFKREI